MSSDYPRRGQLEIFGLVIIVILLTLGLLFAVIVLTQQPEPEAQRVKESIQAANFLNTMMSTTAVDCGKRSVRELLQDCAVSGEEWTGAARCANGRNTCEQLEFMTRHMLQETLGTWGQHYRFFINGTAAAEKITIQSGTCTGEREGSTRPEKVRGGLDVMVTLHICQQNS